MLVVCLLAVRTPPPQQAVGVSRAAGLPWWLPQSLQDGLPDDWSPVTETQAARLVRVSLHRAPRWLPQSEQDGLPDDRPAVTENVQGSQIPGLLKMVQLSVWPRRGPPALSLLRRAIFSTDTHLHDQDNQSDDHQREVRADNAEADASDAR